MALVSLLLAHTHQLELGTLCTNKDTKTERHHKTEKCLQGEAKHKGFLEYSHHFRDPDGFNPAKYCSRLSRHTCTHRVRQAEADTDTHAGSEHT